MEIIVLDVDVKVWKSRMWVMSGKIICSDVFCPWPLPCRVRSLGRSKMTNKRSYFVLEGRWYGILTGSPLCARASFPFPCVFYIFFVEIVDFWPRQPWKTRHAKHSTIYMFLLNGFDCCWIQRSYQTRPRVERYVNSVELMVTSWWSRIVLHHLQVTKRYTELLLFQSL
jgi:hypothetical protein